MLTNTLTKKQKDVLTFLCKYKSDNGFCPSYKDIAAHFKFNSDGTVRTYLEQLEAKHYIKRSGKARSFQLLVDLTQIPILGTIQAGLPIEALQVDNGHINELPVLQYKDSKFALTVKGDSMINAGILDGDIAIIDKNQAIKAKDIIAAQIEDEVTLKRYVPQKTHIELQAENEAYSPIILNNSEKSSIILGKYIGLIRNNPN
jgi:repressor LexA